MEWLTDEGHIIKWYTKSISSLPSSVEIAHSKLNNVSHLNSACNLPYVFDTHTHKNVLGLDEMD